MYYRPLPYDAKSTIAVTGQFKGREAQTYHIPVHSDVIGVCEVPDRKLGRALILFKDQSGAWVQIGEVPVEQAVAWCDMVWQMRQCMTDHRMCGPHGEQDMLDRIHFLINGTTRTPDFKLGGKQHAQRHSDDHDSGDEWNG